MVSFGQLESVWPVTDSVMVHKGLAYATAGRTTEADGGLAVVALDPATGQPTWARGIAPGPNRENDLPAVRDGKVAVHLVRFDPKSSQSQNATLPKGVEDPLESIADGTWTRIGTRWRARRSISRSRTAAWCASRRRSKQKGSGALCVRLLTPSHSQGFPPYRPVRLRRSATRPTPRRPSVAGSGTIEKEPE